MHPDVEEFNQSREAGDREICTVLSSLIDRFLPEGESKIWHAHPVWFIEGNPTVGYSRQKAGVRLMFWSGADFDENELEPGTGKFKDASKFYTSIDQIDAGDLQRWLKKAREIQWDYKNIYKRKGGLERLA